ncbi:MAG: hypothetical protein JSR34_09065 [Proteobacteria bacterium]|nr:hypothetical protein [Pseudomonadota bacterium]
MGEQVPESLQEGLTGGVRRNLRLRASVAMMELPKAIAGEEVTSQVLVPLTMTTVFAAWMAPQAIRAALSRRNRTRWRHLLRSPVSFTMALAVIACVLAIGSLLTVLVPCLGWSWWRALGGTGSVMFNFPDVPSGAPGALVWWAKLLPVVVLVLLLPAVPTFAYIEECAFRRGAESWSLDRRVLVPCIFGLVHAILGVTLAFAIALAFAGALYQTRYLATYARRHSRSEAMQDAVNIHAAYNVLVLSVAACVVFLTF